MEENKQYYASKVLSENIDDTEDYIRYRTYYNAFKMIKEAPQQFIDEGQAAQKTLEDEYGER